MAGQILLEKPAVDLVETAPPTTRAPGGDITAALFLLLGVTAVMLFVFGVSNLIFAENEPSAVIQSSSSTIDVDSISVTDQAMPRQWIGQGAAIETAMGLVTWEQVELLPDAGGDIITNPIRTPTGFLLLTQSDQLLKAWISPTGREWEVAGQGVTQPGIKIRALTATPDGLQVVAEDEVGIASEHPFAGLDLGAFEVAVEATGAAAFDGRRLEVTMESLECCNRPASTTIVRTRVDGGEWQHLEQIDGKQTFGESVAGGPAGWGLTWHQCDPGCGQEIWLSPDLVEWDRIRMSNSARDQMFFIAGGIAIGSESVVVSGLANESSPYSGSASGVVWVGTVQESLEPTSR